MGSIINLIRKFEQLDAGAIAETSLENTADAIADKQAEQMFQGLNAQGDPIGQYRSQVYAEVKNRINPLPGFGVPDLRATGDFYRGIYARVSPETVQLDSTDTKSRDLQKKYGEEIFGLSDKKKGEFIEESLRPEFKRQMEVATGLKLV